MANKKRRTMAEVEEEAIRLALSDSDGNRTKAAKALEISFRSLARRIQGLGLRDLPEKKQGGVGLARKNWVGRKFGEWTVIDCKQGMQLPGANSAVVARCSCGIEKLIPRGYLKSGGTTRCSTCAADRRAKARPRKCPCGTTDPTRYSNRTVKYCTRCARRRSRNGECGTCGAALHKRGGDTYCPACDK